MSFSQGNITFVNNAKSSGGTLNGANNGLSLSGTIVQLGGSLIQNTNIDLAGNNLTFSANGTESVLIRHPLTFELDSDNSILFACGGGAAFTNMAFGNNNFALHNDNSINSRGNFNYSGTQWDLHWDNRGVITKDFTLDSYGFNFTLVSGAFSSNFTIDTQQVIANNFQFEFDIQNGGFIQYGMPNSINTTYVFQTHIDGSEFQIRNENSVGIKRFFSINQTTRKYQIGDMDSLFNSNYISIDDINQSIISYSGNFFTQRQPVGYIGISINYGSKLFKFGDTSASFNRTRIEINDTFGILSVVCWSNNQFTSRTDAGHIGISCNYISNLFQFGDTNSFLNGTVVNVDVTNQNINFIAANGIQTSQPSANGAGRYLLGKVIAGAVTLDTANYVEVKIDGVIKKLLIST